MKKTGAGESMTSPATQRLISSTLLEMRRERYLDMDTVCQLSHYQPITDLYHR